MKKRTYIYAALCVLVIVFVTINCTDEELIKSTPQADMKGFTLQEAKEFFKEQMELKVTKTRVVRKQDGRSLCPDDFVPNWESAIASSQNNLASYDIPIRTSLQYRALTYDFTGGQASAYVVDTYQKLIIVKDSKTGFLGQYILTLIPSKECNVRYKKEICDRFINCSDKGQFTGIAIYSNPLNNMIVRANRYLKGEKVQGVFLSGDDPETLVEKGKILESIIGRLIFKQNPTISTRSFGEGGYDNWGDDYWNDNNNNYNPDDNHNSGGGFNPDHNPNDNDWDYGKENKDYVNIGGGFFIDMKNGVVLYDYDGDGKPDSVWLPEVDVTPNPTPDPDPEPDNPVNVCPYCGSAYCNGSCMGELPGPENPDSGEAGNTDVLPNVRIPYTTSMFPGYGNGLNCKKVADKIMHQILGDDANIGSPATAMQLYKEINGQLTLVGNPKTFFDEINEHLDAGHPIEAGVNHTIDSGINNSDKTTDHFIVIIGRGYDDERGEYYLTYIETGRYKEQAEAAVDDSMRLYYNENRGTFTGERWDGKKTYDLVQIRPNL